MLSRHIKQEVCPWNSRMPARAEPEPRYAARGPGELPVGVEPLPPEPAVAEDAHRPQHPGTAAPPLIDLLEMALDRERWDAFSRASPLRRAGRGGFARNVCVALGNWGTPEAVPVLMRALADKEPLVRGHAAWALGRVGSSEAREALGRAFVSEVDQGVREEVRRALGA